jgi:hypothetical protein
MMMISASHLSGDIMQENKRIFAPELLSSGM